MYLSIRSQMVFKVIQLELTTATNSTISIFRASSSKLLPCVLIKTTNIFLAGTYLSFPNSLTAGGFLCHTI